MNRFIKYCLAITVALGFQVPAFAQASLEEVIVTAQRTEQSLQDVPIAVTALSADDLEGRQVVTFSDLQLNVPSLQFGQGQYANSSISLRGIGALAVGQSYDGSVGYHLNEVPIPTSAIGDENFDVARIEVLRGPQGTLYGRGTTGGAVNVVTNMPDFDETYGRVKVTAGNYNTQKLEGMFNLPINDNFAVRFAGYGLKRDGYIDNLFMPDTHYDNRDQSSGRLTLAFQSGDTSASLMWQNYNEDSHRSRKGDFICTTSPTPDRGCVLGGKNKDMPNPAGTYDGMIGAYLLGIAPPAGNYQKYIDLGLLSGNAIRPTGMTRQQTHSDFEPIWMTDSDTVTFEIAHQLDMGEISASYSTYDAAAYSRADTDMTVGPRLGCRDTQGTASTADDVYVVNEGTAVLATARCGATAALTQTVNMLDLVEGGMRGIKGPTIAEEFKGGAAIFQDKYYLSQGNRTTFLNGNTGEAQNRYSEIKFASDFGGKHEFILGANYMEGESFNRFMTASSPLQQLTLVAAYYLPTFAPHSDFSMQAQGIFGEYYYQINDDMKLTVGARWADEVKDASDIKANYASTIDYTNNFLDGFHNNGIGQLLIDNHNHTAGDVFMVDQTIHNVVLNRAVLHSAALKTTLQSGLASGAVASTSAQENIAQQAAETGVNYNTALNSTTKAYVDKYYLVKDAIDANTRATATYQGVLALKTSGTAAQKQALADSHFAHVGAHTEFAALVNAAGQIPSLYVRDQNYRKPGWPAFMKDVFEYETTAGRIVFDWQYDDNSMMYASYSRGVKPGGINTAANPRTIKPCTAGSSGGVSWAAGPAATCADVPPATNEEIVDTYEIGVKTDLMSGQLRVNATAFFNDYTDLQIASTLNASEFNFGMDAEIFGTEVEMTYLPESLPNWRFDFMASYLDTEITKADKKLNPFNKLAVGSPEDISATHQMVRCTVLIFDGTDACIGTGFIVKKSDLAAELSAGTYSNGTAGLTAAQMWVMDLGAIDGSGNITAYPSYGDRNQYDAQSNSSASTFMDIETSSGVNVNVVGNELPYAPETSFNLTASYTFTTGNGFTIVPSANLYYQSSMFNSEFNSKLTDSIDSWEEVNLGLLVLPANADWTLKAYARNVTDEDNVTTIFNSTDITGSYQTYQYRDPRTVGIELSMDF
jgi:outer membrane receptor protein involved in Fe transport